MFGIFCVLMNVFLTCALMEIFQSLQVDFFKNIYFFFYFEMMVLKTCKRDYSTGNF